MNPIVALAADFSTKHPAKTSDYDESAARVRASFDAIVLTHPTLSKQGTGHVAPNAPEPASTATEGETANEPPKVEETQDAGVQTADTAENADQEPPNVETEAEAPAETAEPAEVAQSEAEPADQGGDADAGTEEKPVAAHAQKGNSKKCNSKKGGRK